MKKRKAKTIVVAGLVTHGCVKATCIDGYKRGFKVVLVEDGHSSFNKEADKLILEWNEKLSNGIVKLNLANELFVG